MKNFFFQIIKFFLYPLIWCYQVVMDAPIISCEDNVIGFSNCVHQELREPEPHAEKAPIHAGWVA